MIADMNTTEIQEDLSHPVEYHLTRPERTQTTQIKTHSRNQSLARTIQRLTETPAREEGRN